MFVEPFKNVPICGGNLPRLLVPGTNLIHAAKLPKFVVAGKAVIAASLDVSARLEPNCLMDV